MVLKYRITQLTLPGGHVIPLDPPVVFSEGEPIPFILEMGGRPAIEVVECQWYEFEEGEEDDVE